MTSVVWWTQCFANKKWLFADSDFGMKSLFEAFEIIKWKFTSASSFR